MAQQVHFCFQKSSVNAREHHKHIQGRGVVVEDLTRRLFLRTESGVG